jgi:site-specific DNA-methyltransferase (adenine-specific)
MARKPFKGSAIDNVLEHGTGALNIDASRVETDEPIAETKRGSAMFKQKTNPTGWNLAPEEYNSEYKSSELGRFPSNVIMDEEAGAILNKQAPKTGNASSSKRTKTGMTGTGASLQWHKSAGESNGISDGLSGASKFFYCPKVSRAERHVGFDTIPYQGNSEPGGMYGPNQAAARKNQSTEGNNHPTVKPVELMKYLVRLVTPPNGKVLDPFNGSGSTGMACVELDYEYVGCELDPQYVEIANNRISAWEKKFDTPANNLFEDN